MAEEKKFKAVIEVGGGIGSSLKTAFAVLSGNTKKLGDSLKSLEGQSKRLSHQIGKGLGGPEAARSLEVLNGQIRRTERNIKALNRIKSANVGGALGGVASRLTFAAGAGLAGAGAAGLAAKSFLDTAAQTEKFQLVLETLEGSAQKAKESLAWISDFAKKTPYDVAGVTEAFVQLRAYGMDPVKTGLLKTLGDTASAMGKPMMQAVEAIADATTGENERLKEFGIKAAKDGSRIIYSYTTKAGKQAQRTVEGGNRAMIQKALQAIWSDKYGGAMDKLSGSWSGLISNLGDSWTRFKQAVMDSGPFQELKADLEATLKEVDAMAADGRLQQAANQIGQEFLKAYRGVKSFGKELKKAWPEIKTTIESLGGLKTVFGALIAIPVLGFVKDLALLGWALGKVGSGLALLAFGNPIGLIVTGVVLLGTAIYILWKNWAGVEVVFRAGMIWIGMKWDELKESVKGFGAAIEAYALGAFTGLKSKAMEVLNWIDNKLGAVGEAFGKVKGWFGGGDSAKPSNAPTVDGARAMGGPVSAGKRYLVGERGPEIFAPRSSGQIIPNGGGKSDNRTFNVTIHAAPGMNERTLADLVIARLNGRQAALAGGALYD
jgi:hypothetical protein